MSGNSRNLRIRQNQQFSQESFTDEARFKRNWGKSNKYRKTFDKTLKIGDALSEDFNNGTSRETAKTVADISLESVAGRTAGTIGKELVNKMFGPVAGAFCGALLEEAARYATSYSEIGSKTVDGLYDQWGIDMEERVCKMCKEKFGARKGVKRRICEECDQAFLRYRDTE